MLLRWKYVAEGGFLGGNGRLATGWEGRLAANAGQVK